MTTNLPFWDFIKKLNLGQKLILSYLTVGALILGVIYYFYYDTTKEAILARTHNQLKSVMNLKKGWLESYFENQKIHINHFTTYYSTQLAFSELDFNYQKYGVNSNAYRMADSLFGKSLKEFNYFNHFKNIWFINKKGDVVYTSIQSGNVGRNIYDTIFYNPQLNQIVNRANQEPTVGDLSYLSTLNMQPFVVIVVPMKLSQTEILGYLLVKLQMNDINNILLQRSGMGKTGESYVVDQYFTMRSKSRFLEEASGKRIVVTTAGALLAQKNRPGQGEFPDYRGIEVLSCFSKLNVEGLNWVLLSEIDYEEAMLPVYALNQKMIVISFFVSLGLIIITFYLSAKISNPIKQMNEKIDILAKGILSKNELEVESEDEIGQITASINLLSESLKKTASFASEIGKGNFQAQYQLLSNQDALGHSLIEMRDQLAKLSNLIAEQNKIKTISLIEGQENERRRISKELHDGIGQMLTALLFKVQELDLSNPIVNSTKQLLDETIKEVRRVSVNLVPSVLYDFGIEAAIKVLIKTVNLPIEFTSNIATHDTELNMEKRICLYRITQEAIHNIQKHAEADRIRIHLEFNPSDVDLVIFDNGKGFDLSHEKGSNIISNGLRNMRERAKLVDGSFEIESTKEKGTKITVNIPV